MTTFKDDVLIAWLVFLCHQTALEKNPWLPNTIRDALLARGWLKLTDHGKDWEGTEWLMITQAGLAAFDLNAADYGCESSSTDLDAVTDD